MKLYNTLTRSVEAIKPLQPPTVTVYTCGPTVYDYPHVGNWFTYIREDILIRTLKASGFQPKWVMNITDVGHLVSDADEGEDKLEKGARREGKTAWDVAERYTDYFITGLERLNISQPDYLPKATDHIDEQIELVKVLETKGYTYIISDGVYFDTSKFPTYPDFARLDIDEQQAGARVQHNPEKRNSSDFALWKFSPHDHRRDMEWDSPWGKGFPGWHIECSAMSMKYLGDTLDIHAGGIDHLPVHHTNEIAQSEAATGKTFALHWMHSNHITIEGEKVSKSLGNGITLEDIEAKGISLAAFRLHVLESHYRSQSKFSWESLEAAHNRLKHWQTVADLRLQPQAAVQRDVSLEAGAAKAAHDILQALQDDLGTPQALARIDSFFGATELTGVLPGETKDFTDLLQNVRDWLGIDLLQSGDITDEQKRIISEREQARTDKEWAKSDELRDTLIQQGIGLRDTPNGAVWYRL
ncbi:MAG TPA: cysteine--tRNA ligase [Candidatus Saccharimonadales bacterium]|nr:cysteine--tRNA ligase [Candidatus Saccharimonadales bacterium]